MATLGFVLVMISMLFTALQSTKTASVLFVAGLWFTYHG